jgi:hypothetical protein
VQCIWALGNIAVGSVVYRDLVLDYNVLDKLQMLVNSTMIQQLNLFYQQTRHSTDAQTTRNNALSLRLLQNITRVFGNSVRNKPAPKWKYVKLIIESLLKILSLSMVDENEQIINRIIKLFN